MEICLVGRGNPKLGGFRDFEILMLCYVLVDVLMISNMLKDVVETKWSFGFGFGKKRKFTQRRVFGIENYLVV